MMKTKTANIFLSAKDDTQKAFESVNGSLEKLTNAFTKVVPALYVFDLLKDKLGAVLDKFSDLQDFDNFGVAVEDAKRFVDVLGMSGASIEQTKKVFSDLSAKINESFNNEQTKAYFKELGISAEDLKKRNVTEIYDKINEKLSTMEDKTRALALSKEFFGKNGLVVFDSTQEERAQRINDRTKEMADKLAVSSVVVDEFKKNTYELSTIFENNLADSLTGPLSLVNAFASSLIEATDEATKTNEALDITKRLEPWRAFGNFVIDWINTIYNGFVKIINFIDLLAKGISLFGTTMVSSFQLFLLETKNIFSFAAEKAVDLYNIIKGIATLDFDKLDKSLDDFLNKSLKDISKDKEIILKPVVEKTTDFKASLLTLTQDSFAEALSNTSFNKQLDKIENDLNKRLKNKNKGDGTPPPPPPPPVGDKKDVDDLVSAQIKIIQKNYEKQKALTDSLAKYNELYYSNQLIDIKDYYKEKDKLLIEDYNNRKLSLDKEIELINKALPKVNNEKDKLKLNEKLLTVQEKQIKNEEDYNFSIKSNNITRDKALSQYSDSLDEIKAKLAEFNGDFGTAKDLRVNIETRNTSKQFSKDDSSIVEAYNNKVRLLKEIETIEKTTAQNSNYYKSLEELADAKSLSNTSSIFDLNKEVLQLKKEQVKVQEEQIKLLEEQQAKDPSNKDLAIKINNAKAGLLKLNAEIDPIAKQLNSTLQSGFEDAFIGIIDGSKSVGDAFTDLTKSIEKDILSLIAKDLSKSLMGSLFGDSGGTSGGFGGAISGLFGGGGSSGSGGLLSGAMDWFGGFFADGGYMPSGKSYIVGERGPEIFTPGQSGYVTNNKLATSGASGSSVNVYMTVNAKDASSFNNSSSQIASQLSSQIKQASRND